MRDWLHEVFEGRPTWLSILMVFCGYMAFVYMPWDIFVKPTARDQEVWFGLMFTGGWAKVLAFPHWFVYSAGFYGFLRRRPWMCFWAPLYTLQIAVGMLIWNILEWGSWTGWLVGIIGAIPFLVLSYALADAREHFCDMRLPLRERYGDWALVTGASSGIGMEFARALAREGLCCVLAARREDRLRTLAGELEREYGVVTRIIPIDLAESDGPERLAEACRDLEIAVLVNNAGLGYAGRFDKQDGGRLRELVAVNCMAPVILTHHLIGGMRERGRGAVIITGSVAGRQPLPLHAAYSASKSFDLLFGEALHCELRGDGIDVLVLEPGSTETEFQEVAGELAHAGEPASRVVEVALEALGQQPAVISGWFNWVRANFAMRLAPRSLVAHIGRDYMAGQTPREMQ